MRSRIRLTRSDALALLRYGSTKWPKKTLLYLDPPYFERGRQLYYDYYKPADHANLARFIETNMENYNWIVSYDNVAQIKNLYSRFRNVVYNIGYSARESKIGKEVMFFSPNLSIPDLVGPIQQVSKSTVAA